MDTMMAPKLTQNSKKVRLIPVGVKTLVLALGLSSSVARGQGDSVKSARPDTANMSSSTSAGSSTGSGTNRQDIAAAIRRSGLTDQEIRARLIAAGYDPHIADSYLSGVSSATAQSVPAAAFADALRNAGIATAIDETDQESAPVSDGGIDEISSTVDRSRSDLGPPSPGGIPIFGRSLFGRSSTLFDPVTSGPVDASYRIGVGDQLQLVLTGSTELAYQLSVRRDGSVVIPQVGQITVAGLTLDAARGLLRQRAAASYSGLNTGAISLDLSIGRIRSNVVFVTGEVERPGSYQVNALSTVFHAIARAGGPTQRGSFRGIEVRRGGALLKQLDLYDYLLRGDASTDVRTEQGDVIFVPMSIRTIGLRGAVRRPAMFELKPGEGFRELLSFSGGILPTAATDRVQIDRIVPGAERKPGRERVVIDVMIHGRLDSLNAVQLKEGDVVTVFAIRELRRNTVGVKGAVFQPGTFQFVPGMSLKAAIDAAQGVLPWGMNDRVKISRPIPETGRTELISLDLRDQQSQDFRLQEYDQITVLDGREAFGGGRIFVGGSVRRPGELSFSEHQTLQDVIDLVGGLGEDAIAVEVSRRRRERTYSDTTSILSRFEVGPSRQLEETAAGFLMARDDRVFVRAAPGYREQRFVDVSGSFRFPGSYALTSDDERLTTILARAGGLLPEAYPESFRLVRSGRPIAIDLTAAIKGDKHQDLTLQPGDQLTIGKRTNTVYVVGEVEHASLVLFEPGRSVDDYIQLAGGARLTGDVSRALVIYPSGETLQARRRFLLPNSQPKVIAGSTIRVPERPAEKSGQFSQSLTTMTQIVATFASLAFTYVALVRR